MHVTFRDRAAREALPNRHHKNQPQEGQIARSLTASWKPITAVIATLFGGTGQGSSLAALAALPVAAWELSLGLWLVVKGFKPSPITAA
jgi:hypothetical protein